jgi:hypothetical protein
MKLVSLVAASLLVASLSGCIRAYHVEPSPTSHAEAATAPSPPESADEVKFPILRRTVELADAARRRTEHALETVIESDTMTCAVTTVGFAGWILGQGGSHGF